MEIIKTRVMRGPNYWSIYRHRLIVLTIQLTEKEKSLHARELDLLGKKLLQLKPSLHQLKSYATIFDVVAQVAIEIQFLAGMDCAHADVQPTANPLVGKVIFSYCLESAGVYAGKTAVKLIRALLTDQPVHLANDILYLKNLLHQDAHDPTTAALPNRMPIVAITGTNGKTTTTRLIAHLAYYANYRVGFTTTDGIYIEQKLVSIGDCSGPKSARVVLNNPQVNLAVLECARGGILRAGLGFQQCNVSVVTNISRDHLGMDDITDLESLAKLKSVVPRTTIPEGCAILNADDDLVYQMKDQLRCAIGLFSTNVDNPRFKTHVQQGNLGAAVENGQFVLFKNRERITVIKVNDVPLTFKGRSACMVQNVLPAMLTAFFLKMPIEDICMALKKFVPSPRFTPGRMNTFKFKDFTVLVDYAHNEAGYLELKRFAEQQKASVKIGIIAAVTDRIAADTVNLGHLAATIFDEIIIRHDCELAEQTKDEMTALLQEGINTMAQEVPVQVISDEFDAIKYAIDHAQKDAWIFVNAENVFDTINYLSSYPGSSVNQEAKPHVKRRGVYGV